MRVEHHKVEPAHSDERRTITPVFNGDFTAKQIKILHISQGNVLGNHYHHYGEMFYLLSGEALYTFKDLEEGGTMEIHLKEGERIVIGPKVAHKAHFLKDTVMVEATEVPYVSAEHNDVRWTEW